jgi:hypothetical protein
MSTQTLRAPSQARQERSGWWAVVGLFVALAVTLAVLIGVASLNEPSKGGTGTGAGSKSGTTQTSVVRVGGDGPYQYHPLP